MPNALMQAIDNRLAGFDDLVLMIIEVDNPWGDDITPPQQALDWEQNTMIGDLNPDNPFLAFEHMMSDMIASGLEMWGKARDAATEAFFFSTYGSPLVQAMVGLRADDTSVGRRIGRDVFARSVATAPKTTAHSRQLLKFPKSLKASIVP